MSELVEQHRTWRRTVLSAANPHFGWKNRSIQVRHGRLTRLREGYEASLEHDPKHDVDSLFKQIGVRARRGRTDDEPDIEKAVGDDGTGRWITVHPNGDEEKGIPVYIHQNPDGSHTITRGAGGKLNGMRLTRIKSEDEYRALSKQRRKEKTLAQKMKSAALEQQMGAAAYAQHKLEQETQHAEASSAQMEAEKEFIATVAKAQGIAPEKLGISPERLSGLDPKIAERLTKQSHQAALAYAKEVHAKTKDVVLSAYSELSKDGLGDIGLSDIVKTATGDSGKGYQAQIGEMAAQNGLTTQGAREQGGEISGRGFLERVKRDNPDMTDQDAQEEAANRAENVRKLHAGAARSRMELNIAARAAKEEEGVGPKAVREFDTTPNVKNLSDAVDILAAAKKMEDVQKRVRSFNADVEEADSLAKLPKASAVVLGHDMSPEQALQAAADSLGEEAMQKTMTKLVTTTNDLERANGSLQAHYSVGQTAAFNAISQAIDGNTLDPLAIDTLGPAAVAQVLASKWKRDLTPEQFTAVKSALAEQHIATQEKVANEALDRADGYMKDAERIPLDAQPATAEEAEAVLSDLAARKELLLMARQTAGVARGRLEAAATLNEAMLHPKTDRLQINLGANGSKDALSRTYALGLSDPSEYDENGNMTREGDFTLHSDGENRILEIHKAGLAKLTQPTDEPTRQRAVRSAAIKNGEHDDPDWLPEGISRRPRTTYEDNPLVAHSVDHTLRLADTDDVPTMAQALKEHIGAKLNEGRDAFTVASDISNAGFITDLGLSEDGQKRYQQAVSMVAPSYYDTLRSSIQADMDPGLKPGSKQYDAAYQAARAAHEEKMNPSSPDYQEAFAGHRETLRSKLESYADDYIEAQQKSGALSADDAGLDKQRIPLDEVAHDALFQATAADPRTQNAFMPLSDVNKASVRSYALEKILGVDPKSQEILSKLTPEETRAFRAWDDLRTQKGMAGIYGAIQEDMAQRHKEEGGGLFGDEEESAPPSLATVDLTNDSDVIRVARENAQALGYKMQVDPETGKMDYLELKPGQRMYAEGSGGRSVEYSPLTEDTIARVARQRIRQKLRQHFLGKMLGSVPLADANFNPEGVLTASNRWDKYVQHMGGMSKAIHAVQEVMAGDLQGRFAQIYQGRTGKKLNVAMRPLQEAQAHAEAVGAPEAAERKLQSRRGEYARVGKDRRGKFTTGSRREKVEASEQLAEEGPKLLGESEKGNFIAPTKRATLGKTIEGALRGMMPYMPIDGPVDVAGNISMAGKAIPRQRAVKLWLENERQGINLAAGGGKTIVGIGTFTQARKQGRANRALFVEPSNIVGQLGGEFLKFIDPSQGLRWHADPGATGDERRAALGDANTHMVVVTPESLRNDVTQAIADDLGIKPEEAVQRLTGLSDKEVDREVHSAMEKRGWNFDFLMGDESHRQLARQSKADSHMARINDSVGRRARFYGYVTADIVKNDASEAWSALNKIAPDKYPQEKQEGFMRKYGRNTVASGLALRQEMEPYIYASSVDMGITSEHHTHLLPMSREQSGDYRRVMNSYRQAKLARDRGDQPGMIKALRLLAPNSFTEQEPENETADRLKRALGTLKEAALNRITNLHEAGAKLDWIAGNEEEGIPGYVNEHKGEPIVIFAHNLGAVKMISERLRDQGHKVATITGNMSSDAKDKAKTAFQPVSGEAKVDILVNSDASAMGANMQRGAHSVNYDTPLTAMLHRQRNARTVRTGQRNHVSLHDLVVDNDFDKRARKRLETKGKLREIMTSPVESLDDTGLLPRLQAALVNKFDKEAGSGS